MLTLDPTCTDAGAPTPDTYVPDPVPCGTPTIGVPEFPTELVATGLADWVGPAGIWIAVGLIAFVALLIVKHVWHTDRGEV